MAQVMWMDYKAFQLDQDWIAHKENQLFKYGPYLNGPDANHVRQLMKGEDDQFYKEHDLLPPISTQMIIPATLQTKL